MRNTYLTQRAAAVTPSDTVDLPAPCFGLCATSGGVASIITVGGDTVTIPLGSQPIYLEVKRVRATGTTATGIVALY